MVSSTAPITSSLPPVRLRLPSACAPFRRGYDHRTDLLFHSVRAGSSPRRRPRLFRPPTYAHTILLMGKLSDGGKIIPRRRKIYKGASADGRRRNNYPERAQVPKNSKENRKLSQSAENTLFQIFIH